MQTTAARASTSSRLARTNHAVDWLMWSDEVAEYIAAFWPRVDAVLMGRKTFEVAAAAGQGAGYPGVANYVFSRTLTAAPAGLTLVRDDAAGSIGCRGRSISN